MVLSGIERQWCSGAIVQVYRKVGARGEASCTGPDPARSFLQSGILVLT